jgi:hypothetical protein
MPHVGYGVSDEEGPALSPPPGLLRSLRTARAQSASGAAASAGSSWPTPGRKRHDRRVQRK